MKVQFPALRSGSTRGLLWWRSVGTKPFSGRDENILKQKAQYPGFQQNGTATMQFIFDLIWNQSCSNYLAAMGQH
jgi:hypothetical protein